jgi:tetratricopeptide (TPR) repeat protein
MKKALPWPLLTGLPFLALSQISSPRFVDVTEPALGSTHSFRRQMSKGTAHWAAKLDAATGIDFFALNGIAVGDYDGDGWDDFYVCQPGGLPNRLYRNQGDGTFADVTDESGLGVLDATASALWVDFRNKGRPDLLVVTAAGMLLFENDGSGRFRKSNARFEIPSDQSGSMMMAAAADYDRDGFVDIYICQYSAAGNAAMVNFIDQPLPYYDANNGAPNHLFRNNGDGTFSNVTQKSGMDRNNSRWSFAAAWADYDQDGDADLYVANDFGRNNLYRNNGDGTFRDVAAEAGVEDVGPAMSVAWGDYDQDGRLDLYISNIWSAAGQRLMAEPSFQPGVTPAVRAMMQRFASGNRLFRNRGDGTFEDVSAKAGVANGGWAWGSGFFDADNDGDEDLLVVNGHVTGTRDTDLESFHWSDVVGTSPDRAVRSARYESAWREFQKRMTEDGWSTHGRERKRVFMNRGDGTFADVSAQSGLDVDDDGRAFGVLDFDNDGRLDVVLKNRTAPQVRIMRNGGQGGHHVTLELNGTRSNRDAIGARVTLACGNAKWTKQVEAGSGFLSQHSRRVHFELGGCDGPVSAKLDWPSGQSQVLRDLAVGQILQITEGSSAVKRRVPQALRSQNGAASQDDQEESGTWFVEPVPVWLSEGGPFVMHAPQGAGSKTILMSDGNGRWRSEDAASKARLAGVVIRRVFVAPPDVSKPFTVLADKQGLAAKVYWGKPADSEIARDIGRLQQPRKDLALPFSGQQYGAVISRMEGYFRIALDLLDAGFDKQSLDYFQRAAKLEPRNSSIASGIGSALARQGKLAEALSHFERAAVLEPASVSARFNIGTTLARLGRFQEAAASLKQAAEKDPQNAEIWANLGNTYLDLQDLSNGRAALERALSLDPKSAMLRNSLGTLYAELGSIDAAEKHLLEAVRLKPDYEQAYLNLALLYRHTGDAAKATKMLNECLRVNPANAEARKLLSLAP